MKSTILLFTIMIATAINAQTAYQKAMNKAFDSWKNNKTIEASNSFERIAKRDTQEWTPLYFAVLTRTLAAFEMPKDEAFKQIEKVEELYDELEERKNDSETKVLKSLFMTVKVSKEPSTYGPTLSGAIIQNYYAALEENPNNPRAMYLLGEYEMGGAQFWGKDPKDYCNKIEKAMELFAEEEKSEKAEYEPNWGKERAESILNTTCAE